MVSKTKENLDFIKHCLENEGWTNVDVMSMTGIPKGETSKCRVGVYDSLCEALDAANADYAQRNGQHDTE